MAFKIKRFNDMLKEKQVQNEEEWFMNEAEGGENEDGSFTLPQPIDLSKIPQKKITTFPTETANALREIGKKYGSFFDYDANYVYFYFNKPVLDSALTKVIDPKATQLTQEIAKSYNGVQPTTKADNLEDANDTVAFDITKFM